MFSGFFGDGDGRLVAGFVVGPIVHDKLAQAGDGSLADSHGHGRVGGNVGQADWEGGVGSGALKLDLGLQSRCLVGHHGVGEQLRELVLHGCGGGGASGA